VYCLRVRGVGASTCVAATPAGPEGGGTMKLQGNRVSRSLLEAYTVHFRLLLLYDRLNEVAYYPKPQCSVCPVCRSE
jgi:hypothetical protein